MIIINYLLNQLISFITNIVDDNNFILTHITGLSGTELKKLLNTCVNKTCSIAVNPITSRANLFLKKLGKALLIPNSLQIRALNNTLKANTENTTVPFCSSVAPKIL